jgi:hypothetical protein
MPQLLRDTIQGELRLVESKERKRPGVLAVVEGVFFVADKPSRNGRVYPRELWENVLSSPDLKRMLQNRLLFGTVGHVEEQLDDLIREGKVSHVVTDLKIMPDGRGWGRAEILDTPVGKVLKTLLESGSRLSVSSKAYGEYEGQTGEGYWRVSPSSFLLERFDFVVDPGFLEAQPQVREVYESVMCRSCEKDVVSKLIEEKSRQEKRIVELLKELEEKDKKLKELEESVNRVTGIRNGLLEREIEAIGDLVVERLGVNAEEISADTLLGVVRRIRKVLEEKLGEQKKLKVEEVAQMRKRSSEVLLEKKLRRFKPNQEFEFEIDEECDIRHIDDLIEKEVSRVLKAKVIIPVSASDYEVGERAEGFPDEEEVYYFYYQAGFEGVDEYEGLYGTVNVIGYWDKDRRDTVYLSSGVIVITDVEG